MIVLSSLFACGALVRPDDVARAKRGRYDFVVFDRAKLKQNYRDADQIVRALAPEYRLKWVIEHRRTKEPVAWVLASGPTS